MFALACFVMSGVPLNDAISNILMFAGRKMIEAGKNRQKIKSPVCEGVLRTEFGRALLGTLSGITFEAEIESDRGKTKVRFLLDPDLTRAELNEGFWVDTDFAQAEHATYN